MTENERAINTLDAMKKQFFGETRDVLDMAIQALEEIQQYRAIGTMKEVRMLKDYKELYDVYKLIGTIEEFRNLKYKKNVIPIATIEFSKEDMQKIVDEKVAQIELDIQEIRAKAIDEFAEALKKHLNEFDFWKYGISDSTNYETRNYDHMIDEIAEQMKGRWRK